MLLAFLLFGHFFWLISGADTRWTHGGMVCSGSYENTLKDTEPLEPDQTVYMPESGKFINIYMIAGIIL